MSNSPNLSLPYIQPSQAQKHVTHNLAIELLDALVHLSLTELYATEPPAEPYEGQILGVARGATAEFEDAGGKLACYTNGGWLFIAPRNGFKAWIEALGAFYVYRDGGWHVLMAVGIERLEGLGLNTGWDQINRLAVSSAATLLNHDGAGHQLKINKAGPAETASLLLQSDFSGRAEIGLAGEDGLSLKVSADGTTWSTALSADAATGNLKTKQIETPAIVGKAVQESPLDTTPGRLMRADWGYGPANAVGIVSQENRVPTGAIIESGQNENGRYVRYADGTQMLNITDISNSADMEAEETLSGIWSFPASDVETYHVLATIRSWMSPSATEVAAKNLSIAATPMGESTAAWSVFSRASTSAVRVDITAFGRWF